MPQPESDTARDATTPPKEESPLARAIRLARGDFEPDDVPNFLQRFADAKAAAKNEREGS